jgi:beta-glucosidase
LDQQSGEQLDAQQWFGAPLKAAVQNGQVPAARIDDMVRRILRSMFAIGVIDHPPVKTRIDYLAHAAVPLETARQGIVLLKNEGGLLPLKSGLKRIALIGGNAHVGVLSGGGSSQATPTNGVAIAIPVGGRGLMSLFRNAIYFPSSPQKAIRAASPGTDVVYDSGAFPQDAAALAATADAAVVFVTRHELEGYDIPNLTLPNGQNELVQAVANANSHTIVVLETGNPVAMPWLSKVGAVLAAWYPGQEGGRAIADILFGTVNPSGRLPITFPIDDAATMRKTLPNLGVEPRVDVSVDYVEGADAGYRWYARHNVQPLFAFGHGLSYTKFDYRNLKISGGKTMKVSFEIRNAGDRDGADVPQLYLRSIAGDAEFRLLGFQRVVLKAGEQRTVEMTVDPRLLAHFDEAARKWVVPKGAYKVSVGHSAADLILDAQTDMQALRF